MVHTYIYLTYCAFIVMQGLLRTYIYEGLSILKLYIYNI